MATRSRKEARRAMIKRCERCGMILHANGAEKWCEGCRKTVRSEQQARYRERIRAEKVTIRCADCGAPVPGVTRKTHYCPACRGRRAAIRKSVGAGWLAVYEAERQGTAETGQPLPAEDAPAPAAEPMPAPESKTAEPEAPQKKAKKAQKIKKAPAQRRRVSLAEAALAATREGISYGEWVQRHEPR